jgi:hypothetical protein
MSASAALTPVWPLFAAPRGRPHRHLSELLAAVPARPPARLALPSARARALAGSQATWPARRGGPSKRTLMGKVVPARRGGPSKRTLMGKVVPAQAPCEVHFGGGGADLAPGGRPCVRRNGGATAGPVPSRLRGVKTVEAVYGRALRRVCHYLPRDALCGGPVATTSSRCYAARHPRARARPAAVAARAPRAPRPAGRHSPPGGSPTRRRPGAMRMGRVAARWRAGRGGSRAACPVSARPRERKWSNCLCLTTSALTRRVSSGIFERKGLAALRVPCTSLPLLTIHH